MIRWVFLSVLVLAVMPVPGAAGAAERPALVYALDVDTRETYVPAFAPPSARELFLLADLPHVLVIRRTRVYYWPVTSRYLPDWETLNEIVDGTLVITDTGGRTTRLPRVTYAFGVAAQPPHTRRLYAGDDAERAAQAFQQASEAFRRAVAAWTAGGAARGDPEPEPAQELVEPRGRGFVLALPAGRYIVALEDASGRVVPESRRDLTVFAARRRGIGYTVTAEQRWTEPLQSLGPDDVLYHDGQEIVYLQPHETFEVPEAAFRRMLDPQDRTGREGRWIWFKGPSILGAVRLVVATGAAESVIRPSSYVVRQRPGSALGYTIESLNGRRPGGLDSVFDALRLDLRHQRAGRFWLVAAEDRPLGGSPRTFGRVTFPDTSATLVALIPLGAAMLLYRRRRARRRSTFEAGTQADPARRRS